MSFGTLDFEILLIIVMMVLDIIVGTIDHDFYSKDSSSGGAIKGLFGKVAIASFLIFIAIITHINDWGEFKGIDNILQIIRTGSDTAVVMLLYYELTSVLAHLQNITGIDFSRIPMVKQELERKALNTHIYKQQVKAMKEAKENESNGKNWYWEFNININ